MIGIIGNGIHDIIINTAYLFIFCPGCGTQIKLRDDLCHTSGYIFFFLQCRTVQHSDPVDDRIITAVLLLPCHICHMIIQIISGLRISVLIICKGAKQDIPDILLAAVLTLCQLDGKDLFPFQHLAAGISGSILQRCISLCLCQQIRFAGNCIG